MDVQGLDCNGRIVDFDTIEVEINDRLQGYNINDEHIHKIAEEVKGLLEERGVVFFES